MIDKERLKLALENYKKDFPTWFAEEKYKWEAVKCFQDNWNIEAKNFEGMIRRSLSKTYNLLTSTNNFAAEMIIEFSKMLPEETRAMFVELFNENENIYSRINNFKKNSEDLLKKYVLNSKSKYKNSANKHYQTESPITTYLWLRYPEKYYRYKFTEAKDLSNFLNSSYNFKKGAYEENLQNFFKLYDEICKNLRDDTELIEMLQNGVTEFCYNDSEMKILTTDFGYYVGKFCESFSVKKSSEIKEKNLNSYTKGNFLSEVFISEEKYNKIITTLERKKNIILQGAPGVGKTFAAKRLAYSIIGEKNDFQIEFVQFHQNYSYEDFVIGWRPAGNNFELRTGIFYDFCRKAALNPDKEFFFIIDEINRGNLSKIFGELLMLIESDHRGEKIKIPANGEDFFVPENLYIIGMMNTADRSLALIDYALRRRFSFINFEPAFDSEGFKTYQKNLQNNIFDKLIEQIKILNKEISEDKSLGKSFCIGHSYFCNFETCDENILRSIVDYEILPMLEEYFFDNEEKFQNWTENLHEVFK